MLREICPLRRAASSCSFNSRSLRPASAVEDVEAPRSIGLCMDSVPECFEQRREASRLSHLFRASDPLPLSRARVVRLMQLRLERSDPGEDLCFREAFYLTTKSVGRGNTDRLLLARLHLLDRLNVQGELRDGGRIEHRFDREIHIELFRDSRDHTRSEQGVASQIEKVVVDADLADR